jgi:hypothetical protein
MVQSGLAQSDQHPHGCAYQPRRRGPHCTSPRIFSCGSKGKCPAPKRRLPPRTIFSPAESGSQSFLRHPSPLELVEQCKIHRIDRINVSLALLRKGFPMKNLPKNGPEFLEPFFCKNLQQWNVRLLRVSEFIETLLDIHERSDGEFKAKDLFQCRLQDGWGVPSVRISREPGSAATGVFNFPVAFRVINRRCASTCRHKCSACRAAACR